MIRTATVSDHAALMSLCWELSQQSDQTGIAIQQADHGFMSSALLSLLGREDAKFIVAEVDGALIGVLGLIRVPHLLTGLPLISELCWWVSPQSRGRVGIDMLRMAEQWASAVGGSLEMAAATPQQHKVFARRGYLPAAQVYERRVS